MTVAVVIGSGPNGLSAAITLAEAGRDVLVLEAAAHLGGAVATAELTLPDFHHDVFSAVYPASVASPAFAGFELERHGLRWIQPHFCYAHPLPGGRAVALSRSVDDTCATLDALQPGDGDRWREFVAPYLQHFGAVRHTMLAGFPPVRGPAELAARMGVPGLLEFVRLLFAPAHALGDELFLADGARAWLYGPAVHGDVPPDGAGSAIAAAYLNLLGHAVGWPSPEGGAARLADALVGRLTELGGRTRTGARVTRVAVEGGRVTGVQTADGEAVATSLVVGDVTPDALLGLTGDALPTRYARQLRRYRMGPATVKVDWALDGPIPWEAPEARRAGTVHVGGTERETLRATTHIPGELAEQPFILLGQQSVHDASRAPAGKHTAWAYTHGPHEVDWAAQTDPHVERMEARIEEFAPGFRDRILARHVMGPAGLQERNPNLVQGDVGAGSYSLDQVIFRPVPTLTPYRTPVRGLFMGSAATFPGGAVHGVPGRAAARMALAEARVRRF
ncbi:MAG TPA: NAD(P)/FAD-dependent oxidoreductase [Solirubrobacteraceae bacterium]|nr:NAD(P)/FAD-dependent oxidoreductase [Solirubrobacteraceae bacterium]